MLQRGDLLVLFTDGLPEAVGGRERAAFGFSRMRALLSEAGSAARVHDRVIMAFDQHVGNDALNDDYTLVVMARN